jgi:DNA-binding transcriptional regulator YhcF (GntR family)
LILHHQNHLLKQIISIENAILTGELPGKISSIRQLARDLEVNQNNAAIYLILKSLRLLKQEAELEVFRIWPKRHIQIGW